MMTQTIRVDHVLREAVRTPYSDLVTRTTGALVRSSIARAISERRSDTTVLDFSDVGLVDFSCADEVVAKLLQDPPGETFLVLRGLREEQLEAIEHVLAHHALAALVDVAGGAPRVLGHLDPDHEAAFLYLSHHGRLSADELAALADWPLEQARAVLAHLGGLRLARATGPHYSVPSGAA
jgi:hypothetical protein